MCVVFVCVCARVCVCVYAWMKSNAYVCGVYMCVCVCMFRHAYECLCKGVCLCMDECSVVTRKKIKKGGGLLWYLYSITMSMSRHS